MDNFDWTHVTALAWPVAVVVIVIVLRKPLARALAGMAGRVTSVGFGKFSVELAPTQLTALRPDLVVDGEDLAGLSSERVFSSSAMSLFKQLAKRSGADYVVIDLREGEAWLTSRLFIFAVVLGELRGIRAFVFVSVRDGEADRFVGIARPRDIERRLAARFPRLESALFQARYDPEGHKSWPNKNAVDPPELQSPAGADTWVVQSITHRFIHRVRRKTLPKGARPGDWLAFTDPDKGKIHENAQWLTPLRLDRLLGDALSRASFHDDPDLRPEARAGKVLRASGDFVAAVDGDKRFLGLIDRRALLEKLAPDLSRQIEA
ncbi:MAG: hypothetical protein QNJ16_15975 [Rhodobacter sp.]|nr:hypothetical protein [Rhodobacter sp.]